MLEGELRVWQLMVTRELCADVKKVDVMHMNRARGRLSGLLLTPPPSLPPRMYTTACVYQSGSGMSSPF